MLTCASGGRCQVCSRVHKLIQWQAPLDLDRVSEHPGSSRLERRAVTARTSTDSARDIPEATVARLPVYLRALIGLAEAGTATCSSEELATATGVNSAKLRKDLSHLGSYGTR